MVISGSVVPYIIDENKLAIFLSCKEIYSLLGLEHSVAHAGHTYVDKYLLKGDFSVEDNFILLPMTRKKLFISLSAIRCLIKSNIGTKKLKLEFEDSGL
jgi:hypothetical protein